MVPVSQTGTQDSTQLYFAHFANGSSITSDLVFVNVASEPILPIIYFYDRGGELMAPASVVDVGEDLQVRADGALTVGTPVPPLGRADGLDPWTGRLGDRIGEIRFRRSG